VTSGADGVFRLTARRALLLFILVLVLRIVILAQFRGNYDTQSFLIVADATLRGQNVYTATDRYNYSPVWSFVVAALWWMARPNVFLFIALIGLLQTAADVVTAGLIWKIAVRRLGFDEEGARRAALLFFSNPVSVAVSSGHGQFDGLSILFLLAAIWFATAPDTKGSRAAAVASLSLSLLVKHITAFHPPLFWKKWRRSGLSLWEIAVPYAVFVLSLVPYLPSFSKLRENVLLYPTMLRGSKGQSPGGLQSILTFSSGAAAWSNLLALSVLAWILWTIRGTEIARASLILFLALLVFLPSTAIQYFVWPVALGSLYASPAFAVFSGVAAVCHTGFPAGLRLPWPVRVQILGVWLAGLSWLVFEMVVLFRARRRTAALSPEPPVRQASISA
jgi:hypothetical protein